MNTEDRLEDRDWLYEKYWGDGLSVPEIAEVLGVSKGKVYGRFRKHEIDRRTKSEAIKNKLPSELDDVQYLSEEYLDKGKSCAEIANDLDVSDDTVLRAIHEAGIETRDAHEKGAEKQQKPLEKEKLVRLYHIEEKSAMEIADELGCSARNVYRWMERHGVKLRDRTQAIRNGQSPVELRDREWLKEHYVEHRKSTNVIASELGCASSTVLAWLRRHNIDIRHHSETQVKEGRRSYGVGWNESKKERVREVYERSCGVCGKPEDELNRRLDVHHIIPARQFSDPEKRNSTDNLIALCPTCHSRAERIAPLLPQS